MNYSERLIANLKDQNESVSVPKELCDLLDLSLDSVYRRLRGEVEFTFSEAVEIARYFKISLDSFADEDAKTSNFNYNHMYKNSHVFAGYLKNVNDLLNYVRSKEGRVSYICNDLPISQSFKSPILRAFKIFYWQRVVLGKESYKSVRFGPKFQLIDTVNHSIQQMLDHYNHVQVEEIWNENSLDSTIRQIEYCNGLGLFDDDDAYRQVKNAVLDLVNDIESQLGSVDVSETKFRFYACSIELGNNCVQMISDGQYNTFLNFSIFNSVSSNSRGFGQEVEAWKKTLLNKSTQIAGESEVVRHKFFNHLRSKLNRDQSQ